MVRLIIYLKDKRKDEDKMAFKELSNLPVSERESEVSNYWDEINLLEKSVETRDKENSFVFYEGPPTANGKPGIHHVMGRTLKDTVCRYKTMQGYKVIRKIGWCRKNLHQLVSK